MEKIIKKKSEYIELEPNPSTLAISLRAFGYDITTAIADIIDNSITAAAKNIRINFIWAGMRSTISIIDDGIGMSEAKLNESMRLGTVTSESRRDIDDLGRFGLGLKTASFSQSKILTVATKQDTGEETCRRWDIDVITTQNKWLLIIPPLEEQKSLFNNLSSHGTVVEWSNLDKILQLDSKSISSFEDYFMSIADDVKNHISVTYESFSNVKDPVNFWINGRKIEMWDPFLSDNSFTTFLGEDQINLSDGKTIKISSYILPHHSKLSAEEYSRASGTRGWNDQQGFYLYRNNRLIIQGDWFDLKLEKKEAYRLARIRIDIDNTMDDIWGIDVKKAKAIPPAILKKDLQRIAKLTRVESSKIFRHRGKSIARSADKNNSYMWEQRNVNNKYYFAINRAHPLIKKFLDEIVDQKAFEQLLKLLESSVPIPLILNVAAEEPNGQLQDFNAFSDNELLQIFKEMYNFYIKYGKNEAEIINIISKSEPFIYRTEIVNLFKS